MRYEQGTCWSNVFVPIMVMFMGSFLTISLVTSICKLPECLPMAFTLAWLGSPTKPIYNIINSVFFSKHLTDMLSLPFPQPLCARHLVLTEQL